MNRVLAGASDAVVIVGLAAGIAVAGNGNGVAPGGHGGGFGASDTNQGGFSGANGNQRNDKAVGNAGAGSGEE